MAPLTAKAKAEAAARAKAEAAEQPGTTAEKPGEEKKAEVETETKKGLAEAKKDVEKKATGEKTKKEIKDLREKFEAAKEDLNVMLLSRYRRERQIDVNSLVPNTEEGITNVEVVFKDKLLLDADTVDWMGEEMRKALRTAESAESDEKRQLFVNAENNRERCKEVFGDGFYYAYLYFKEVKDKIGKYQPQDKTQFENLRKRDSDPIIGSVVDKGTELAHDIVKSVQEGDYEKMALYGIAAYSFYKIWNKWIGPKLSSNNEKDFPWGSILLVGAGAYCGLSIFAPNTLKKLWGKGVHADAKGTAAEDLIGLLKVDPAAAEKGVEIGVLAAVTEANVKDIFLPMISFEGNSRYDTRSTNTGMIQLTNPGIAKYFDSEVLAAGPVYPDQPPFAKRTPMQKAYAKACEQLYKSAMWLKQEWDRRVLTGKTPGDKKFENAFLKETSGDFKMADLYRKLGTYSASVVPEMPWTDDLKKEAEIFLKGAAGAKGMFETTDNVRITQLEPNFAKLRVKDFPFIMKLKEDSEGNRQYLFFPANDNLPSSTPLATVNANDPESMKAGAVAVKGKIEDRMDELLANYDIEGASGDKAKKYEEGRWFAEVEMPGVLKHKIPARTVKAVIHVEDDGESLKFMDSTGSKTIYFVSKEMKEHYDYAPQILNAVKNQFEAFSPMLHQMKFEGDPNSDKFDLFFSGDDELSLRMRVDENGKYSIVDKEQEKKLVQNEVFRTTYVEAFAEQEFGFFDEMKKKVDRMPQSYFLYFFQGMPSFFSGLKVDKWLNPNSDVISGSIPNYFTYMLIESKRDALKYRLFWKMADATSFEDLEDRKSGLYDQLHALKGYYENFKTVMASAPKNRDSWPREDFMMRVVEPLRSAGVSPTYLEALDYFENSVFTKIGYKGQQAGDISERVHAVAGQLLGVFYYYTADHDEFVKFPSEGEKVQFENYCKYVTSQILDQYEEPVKGTPNIPPTNFNVMSFDEFKLTPGSDKLSGINEQGPMSVDEVKNKLTDDYNRILTKFKDAYPKDVKYESLNAKYGLLTKPLTRPDGTTKAPVEERAELIVNRSGGRRDKQLSLLEEYKLSFIQDLYSDDLVWHEHTVKERWNVFWKKLWI